MSASELVEEISKKVPRQVQIDILRETFPQGKVTGDLFTIGSTSGESGKSLKIDINPRSPYFMKGQDFNGGVGIGGVTTSAAATPTSVHPASIRALHPISRPLLHPQKIATARA